MKTFKIRFSALTLVVLFFGLLFSACEKEEIVVNEPRDQIEEQTQLPFKKEVTLTDVSGKSNVVVLFSSDNESFINDTDFSKLYSIEPIFEEPELNAKETVEAQVEEEQAADETLSTNVKLNIKVVSEQLEQGAIGLKLKYEPNEQGFAKSAGSVRVYSRFETYYDYVRFVLIGSWPYRCDTFNAKASKKTTSKAPYIRFASRSVCSYYAYAIILGTYYENHKMKVEYDYTLRTRFHYYLYNL